MAFAEDIYAEGGLNFPCVAIQRDYADVEDIIRMCRRRIRVPDIWYGDYLATLGAARVGERRITELLDKYGPATVRRFVKEWLDYSERSMAAAISRLPERRLTASSTHDPIDCAPDGIPITVQLDIKPSEGTIVVDLRTTPTASPPASTCRRPPRPAARSSASSTQYPKTYRGTPAHSDESRSSYARAASSEFHQNRYLPRWPPPMCSSG